MSRLFKTGEWVLVNTELTTSKGEVLVPAGGEARIMVYDPSKEATPYGLRTPEGHVTQIYVAESTLCKHPARAHETPSGA